MVAMNKLLDQRSIVARYVAVWNEPDAANRRASIESLWHPNGAHLSATKEAHGYAQLEQRIATTYQRWVVEEGCSFHSLGDVKHHHDALTFRWEMRSKSGKTESIGRDVILLDASGLFRCIYQFIEE